MNILLIYGGGRQQEALLLEGTQDRMRVILRGQADTVEFRNVDGAWVAESGATVEIGAVLAGGAAGIAEDFFGVALRWRPSGSPDALRRVVAN